MNATDLAHMVNDYEEELESRRNDIFDDDIGQARHNLKKDTEFDDAMSQKSEAVPVSADQG